MELSLGLFFLTSLLSCCPNIHICKLTFEVISIGCSSVQSTCLTYRRPSPSLSPRSSTEKKKKGWRGGSAKKRSVRQSPASMQKASVTAAMNACTHCCRAVRAVGVEERVGRGLPPQPVSSCLRSKAKGDGAEQPYSQAQVHRPYTLTYIRIIHAILSNIHINKK